MTAQGSTPRSGKLRTPPQNRRATFLMCYGPEFVAKIVREWIATVGAKTAYIEPGSPLGDLLIAAPRGHGSTALLSMGERLLREFQQQAA